MLSTGLANPKAPDSLGHVLSKQANGNALRVLNTASGSAIRRTNQS